ncbi:MAG TPA: hypothetical protein VMH87_11235 [Pseudomonadales bacterium]|nr:hypothetical protein [Pseudomonadales bacterium]
MAATLAEAKISSSECLLKKGPVFIDICQIIGAKHAFLKRNGSGNLQRTGKIQFSAVAHSGGVIDPYGHCRPVGGIECKKFERSHAMAQAFHGDNSCRAGL